MFKNSLITVKVYFNNPELQEADAMSKKPRMGEIYKNYVDRCFKAGAMDFDDLLLKTNELLARFPDVLAKYQNRFRYILVDEYQDTNHSQYLIVKALAIGFKIYAWWAMMPRVFMRLGVLIFKIFLTFKRIMPMCKPIDWFQNYRSTKNIVEAANCVIEHNQSKLEKVVWTANTEDLKLKSTEALPMPKKDDL